MRAAMFALVIAVAMPFEAAAAQPRGAPPVLLTGTARPATNRAARPGTGLHGALGTSDQHVAEPSSSAEKPPRKTSSSARPSRETIHPTPEHRGGRPLAPERGAAPKGSRATLVTIDLNAVGKAGRIREHALHPTATLAAPPSAEELARPSQKAFATLTNGPSPRVAVYRESLRRAASIESLAKSRYGEAAGMEALNKIRRTLGKSYEVLVADPGIVMRLDDFLAFAATRNKATAPWELRELYSQHLGTAQVYRGLAITDEQAKGIQKDGMLAGYLRSDAMGNREWSQGNPFTQNFYSMMKERIHGDGWGPISAAPEQPIMDGLMSVSYKRDIAYVVSGGLVKQIGRPDLKIYIYRVDVPKLDLLPGPVFDRLPTYVNHDELFAPFRITPQEIVSVEGPLEPKPIDLRASSTPAAAERP